MTLEEWKYKEAKWWQFWLPQSGPVGGMLLGVSFVAILDLVCYLIWR